MRTHVRSHKTRIIAFACMLTLLLLGFSTLVFAENSSEIQACIESTKRGLLKVPDDRSQRFWVRWRKILPGAAGARKR